MITLNAITVSNCPAVMLTKTFRYLGRTISIYFVKLDSKVLFPMSLQSADINFRKNFITQNADGIFFISKEKVLQFKFKKFLFDTLHRVHDF